VKKRAENASTAILHPFEISASFSTFHMKVGAFNTSATVASNVIPAEGTPSEIRYNSWGCQVIFRNLGFRGDVLEPASVPSRAVSTLEVAADFVATSRFHDLI
jgi:hypothetical protein